MRDIRRQQGLGGIGLLLVVGLFGLAVLVVVKCLPLYLNQLKVARVVEGVSSDPELASADALSIREHLQRRWMIEDIDGLTPADIKIKRRDSQRLLTYDYEARAHLFYNISVVVQFQDQRPIGAGTGGE